MSLVVRFKNWSRQLEKNTQSLLVPYMILKSEEKSSKLPVIKVIVGAFENTYWHGKTFLTVLLWPVTGLTLLSLMQNYWSEEWPEALYYLIRGLYSVIFFVFAITIHRVILLGAKSVPKYGLNRWTYRETRFAGWAILLGLGIFLTTLLTDAAVSLLPELASRGQAALFIWAITFSMIYILARLIIMFPAIAVDKKNDLSWVLRITNGNGWRIAAAVLPFPLLFAALQDLLWRNVVSVVEAVILTMGSIFLYVVVVAALSIAYKELVNKFEKT